MRTSTGSIAVTVVALFLGVLGVSQFRSQDVYSRSLQLETPASLTTLIASLAEKNDQLRAEIFDLRGRLGAARDAVASGRDLLDEGRRQAAQLSVFAVNGPVSGPGIAVIVDGQFDERALSDLVNELRNAGAEAIAVNEKRVNARSYFAPGPSGSLLVDTARVSGPWTVRAIGAPDVMYVAITRTGGILGQFELIYQRTRFTVSKQTVLDLPGPR